MSFTAALPHGPLREVLPDVFFVTGTFRRGILRFSRNMTVVRDGEELTLVNAVRLDDAGLAELDALGRVRHVVKLGFYHGIDDPFYVDRYAAKLWALPEHQHEGGLTTDVELREGGEVPFSRGSLFVYRTAFRPEAVLHVDAEGGVLVACDSLHNWTRTNEYFNGLTKFLFRLLGFIGPPTVPRAWRIDARPRAEDFERLNALEFAHLLSAHGEPLLGTAHEALEPRFRALYGVGARSGT
jgi:hypothetical protein